MPEPPLLLFLTCEVSHQSLRTCSPISPSSALDLDLVAPSSLRVGLQKPFEN